MLVQLASRRYIACRCEPTLTRDADRGTFRSSLAAKLHHMCGRYVSPELAVLQREYRAELNSQLGLTDAQERAYEQSYNVAPTQFVPVVRVIRDQAGAREAVLMRWGLIPFWAKGVPPKYSTINCTVENLETAATWRDAWKQGQRCVIPCSFERNGA